MVESTNKVEKQGYDFRGSVRGNWSFFFLKTIIQCGVFFIIYVFLREPESFGQKYVYILMLLVATDIVALFVANKIVKWAYARKGYASKTTIERIDYSLKSAIKFTINLLIRALFITISFIYLVATWIFHGQWYDYVITWIISVLIAKGISLWVVDNIF